MITTEHSLDGHHGDVDCVLRTIGRTSNPVVLVGHSYGGGVLRGSLQDTLSSAEQDRSSHNRLQPDCPSRVGVAEGLRDERPECRAGDLLSASAASPSPSRA